MAALLMPVVMADTPMLNSFDLSLPFPPFRRRL
jgi:hypothetical protein